MSTVQYNPAETEIRSMFISHTASGFEMLKTDKIQLTHDDRAELKRLLNDIRKILERRNENKF